MKRTIFLVSILLSGLVLTLDVEGQRRKSQRQTQPKPPPSKPAPAPTPTPAPILVPDTPAAVDQPPKQPSVAYDGLYQIVTGLIQLRFYEDGTVLQTWAAQGERVTDSSDTLKVFNKLNDTRDVDKGSYSAAGGRIKIEFHGFGYEGSIENGRLSLLHYPGGDQSRTYEFIVARNMSPDVPPEKPSLRYDGTWVGTTSQNSPISIVIRDGLVLKVTIGHNVPDNRCFFPSSIMSTDYSSSTTRIRVYEGKDFHARGGSAWSIQFFLGGKATSDHSMSGEVGFAVDGCQDTTVKATWSATRTGTSTK